MNRDGLEHFERTQDKFPTTARFVAFCEIFDERFVGHGSGDMGYVKEVHGIWVLDHFSLRNFKIGIDKMNWSTLVGKEISDQEVAGNNQKEVEEALLARVVKFVNLVREVAWSPPDSKKHVIMVSLQKPNEVSNGLVGKVAMRRHDRPLGGDPNDAFKAARNQNKKKGIPLGDLSATDLEITEQVPAELGKLASKFPEYAGKFEDKFEDKFSQFAAISTSDNLIDEVGEEVTSLKPGEVKLGDELLTIVLDESGVETNIPGSNNPGLSIKKNGSEFRTGPYLRVETPFRQVIFGDATFNPQSMVPSTILTPNPVFLPTPPQVVGALKGVLDPIKDLLSGK